MTPDCEMPYTDEEMRSFGFVGWRCLPDASVIAVTPMLFGNGRLAIDIHGSGYPDFYCFASVQKAIDSMRKFNPEHDEEPDGWTRHFLSGRRRLEEE